MKNDHQNRPRDFTKSYTSVYMYDKMGNIRMMRRNGLQDGGTYGMIDYLFFTYNGNQISKITDAVADPTYNAAFNFVDGTDVEVEYEYDGNGNMTKDLNKNIWSVQYNLLNLPQTVEFTDHRLIIYAYDATGRKHRAVYVNPGSVNYYCGNMLYEDGTLKQINIDGGYITFDGTTPVYHYYLKDHLGNNRVVVNASGAIEQVNHYYPFGGLFGESTGGDAQTYKYNGKELDRMHGLDWYDYGARYMSPDVGRFTTIDPLAEKYYSLSPYVYCGNDPVNAVDLRGDSIKISFEHQDEILSLINNVSEGEFGVDDKGYLYMKHDYKPSIDTKRKSSYYKDVIMQGISSPNIISIFYTNTFNYKNEKYNLSRYGEGLTINEGKHAWVLVSGKNYTTRSGTECSPDIILAHELAGHAIPRLSFSFTDSRYDGLAVTTENVIRKEIEMPLRKWGRYEKSDRSVGSYINPFGRVVVNRSFLEY